MKSAKELFERLKTDEAFAKEFAEALKVKREAGAKNYYETMIPTANEFGYEVTKEDLDETMAVHEAELSPEELGKVAGGSACFTWFIVASVISASGVASLNYYAAYDQNSIPVIGAEGQS